MQHMSITTIVGIVIDVVIVVAVSIWSSLFERFDAHK